MVIGIYGGIASGKSSVASFLRGEGFQVLSADEIYYELIAKGKPLYENILSMFGAEITDRDGNIERGKLSKIVFNDPPSLERLNRITHPAIVAEIERQKERLRDQILFIEAPLLVESGFKSIVDKLWLIDLDPELQIERLMQRNNLTRDEALLRINSQTGREERLKHADRVIDNSGTPEESRRQLLYLLEELDATSKLTDDQYCFACGKDNPCSLKLKFSYTEECLKGIFIPLKQHQGYKNYMHGGIASTILDEAMARFLIDVKKIMVMTAKIEVKFKKPVITASVVHIEAVYRGMQPPFHKMSAKLTDNSATPLVVAEGLFAEINN